MAPALDVFDDTRETPLADTNSVHGLSETSARHISLWQDKVRGGFAAFPVFLQEVIKLIDRLLTDIGCICQRSRPHNHGR